MTTWKPTPRIKLYEALGALADGRVTLDGNTARVASSDNIKHYDVSYDPSAGAIMTNDNGSYWQRYLGYPGVAFLLARGIIATGPHLAKVLRGFAWKDLATQYKNDWAKVEQHVRQELVAREVDMTWFDTELERVAEGLVGLKLEKLGARKRPPKR